MANEPDQTTILLVGGEGGGISLVRRQSGGEWLYRVVTSEGGLLDEDDQVAPISRPWVPWTAAVEQLDQYPWPGMYPEHVNLDFSEQIHDLLRKREKAGQRIDWRRWRAVLGTAAPPDRVSGGERITANKKEVPVRWADICRVMRLMGQMEDFSKAECLRIAGQLKKQIKAGTAKKLSRGLYTVVLPD